MTLTLKDIEELERRLYDGAERGVGRPLEIELRQAIALLALAKSALSPPVAEDRAGLVERLKQTAAWIDEQARFCRAAAGDTDRVSETGRASMAAHAEERAGYAEAVRAATALLSETRAGPSTERVEALLNELIAAQSDRNRELLAALAELQEALPRAENREAVAKWVEHAIHGAANGDWEAARDEAVAGILSLAGEERWRPTHRHVKRGTDYQVIGEAELQQASQFGPSEGDRLTVYQGQDGKLWARATSEFEDGRFDPLPPPPRSTKP